VLIMIKEYVIEARKFAVKTAALCLVANAVIFPMSGDPVVLQNCTAQNNGNTGFVFLEVISWRERADQLYHTLVASAERSEIDQIIKKELSWQSKTDRQKILDYLLERSIDQKWFDKAEIFLEHGANRDARAIMLGGAADWWDGVTLLMDCAHKGDAQQVQFLLDHGADPRRYSGQGISALFHLFWNKNEKECSAILELLVKVMPIDYPTRNDQNRPSFWGSDNKTLLYIAVMEKKFSLAKQLLRVGANPNCVAKVSNFNPIDFAIRFTKEDVSKEEQERKNYYTMAKRLYCYGGRPQSQNCLLADTQKEEFEQAKEAFDLFNRDKAYLGCTYSPEIRQQHFYQKLHDRALVSLLYASSPMPVDVARIACDYSPCMIPDFFDEEDWAREGFAAPPARTMVQNGDGRARSCEEGETYGDGDDEKADY